MKHRGTHTSEQLAPLPEWPNYRSKPTVRPTTHCMVPALDCLPPPISASAPNFFLTQVCLHRAKRPLLNQDFFARKLAHLLSNALGDVNSRNGPLSPSGRHRSEGLSVSGPMTDTSFAVEVFHTRRECLKKERKTIQDGCCLHLLCAQRMDCLKSVYRCYLIISYGPLCQGWGWHKRPPFSVAPPVSQTAPEPACCWLPPHS